MASACVVCVWIYICVRVCVCAYMCGSGYFMVLVKVGKSSPKIQDIAYRGTGGEGVER